MKKLYTLFLISIFTLLSANMLGQTSLIFSEYIEGSSNNKALEIFNPSDAAVDLAAYQIAQSSNGGGWAYYHSFPADASIEAGGVWVIITDQTDEALFPAADADEALGYPSVVHHNGDDARGLVFITDTDTTLIDVIGVPDEDPGDGWEVAGVPDATKEHTLVRKNHINTGNTDWAISAGTDEKDSEWMVYDQNFFDSLGVHTYIPIIDVATINLTGEGDATTIETDKGSLQINAEILPADASNKNIMWSVSDITLASISEDGLLSAINDGVVTVTATAADGSGVTGTIDITNSNQTPVVPVSSITVTGAGDATTLTENGGTLQMEAAVLPAEATDMNYTWSINDMDVATIDANGLLSAVNNGTVTVTATADDGFGGMGSIDIEVSNQYTEVADLTALKAMDPTDENTVYKVAGEVIITNAESYKNRKYVQDAAGGVFIEDSPGNITTAFNVGDGITGLMGTIEEYNGMLKFKPVADPGAATSTGNEIVPVVLTPAELIAGHDMYESMVVVLRNVTYPDSDGTVTFANGKNYDLADKNDTTTCRVNFYNTDLTGMVIPYSAHVTGIVLEYKGSVQLAPRSAADVEDGPAYLMFSEYIEGSSNNKALEIHNPTKTAVDLAAYQIAQSSNGGGWAYYHSFPADASIAAGDVWVIITDQTDEALYPSAEADEVLGYPSTVHHNGDDARGLIYIMDNDTTMMDVIGVPDEDPGDGWEVAGVADATKEHTLVRKNHIMRGNTDWALSAGTDVKDSEWMVYDQNFFDSLGIHTYIPIIDVTDINLTGEGDATTIETDKGSLQIIAEILPADASDKNISWEVSDITLASISETGLLSAINDGVVTVTATALDGSGVSGTIDITNSNQTPVVPVASITVTGAGDATAITENGGTLQMEAAILPADATDLNYTWSVSDMDVATIDANGLLTAVNIGTVMVTATADDGFGGMGSVDIEVSNQYTEVADLTALKAMDPSDENTVYKVAGEVLVTYTQSYRNKKYVQDAAGGVEVDDSPGNISTTFAVGDGMTGLMGTLEEYNGLLQFHPVADPGAATSTGNEIVPVVLTPAELIADHDMYESMVVMLKSVTYPDADGSAAFENGQNYDLADAMDTLACRTSFYDTDLIGTVIPDSAHVTGIVLEYNGSVQLAPRSAADVEELILYIPSDDASISDLLVAGTSIDGFTPAQLTYYVELPEGTTDVPELTAVTNHDSAVVTVTDATDLGGTEAERTSKVLITAEDMMSTKTYDVVFSIAVGINGQQGESFEVYPIPADDFLWIKSAESLQEMRIISITGSTVRIKELSGEQNIQLNISDLESGVYFLKVTGDTSSRILRFVKN